MKHPDPSQTGWKAVRSKVSSDDGQGNGGLDRSLGLDLILAIECGYLLRDLDGDGELTGGQLGTGSPQSTPADESLSPFGRETFFHFKVVV